MGPLTRDNKKIPADLDGNKWCAFKTLFALGIQEWAISPAAEANRNIHMDEHSNLCIPHSPMLQLPTLRGMTPAILILDSGRVTSSPWLWYGSAHRSSELLCGCLWSPCCNFRETTVPSCLTSVCCYATNTPQLWLLSLPLIFYLFPAWRGIIGTNSGL